VKVVKRKIYILLEGKGLGKTEKEEMSRICGKSLKDTRIDDIPVEAYNPGERGRPRDRVTFCGEFLEEKQIKKGFRSERGPVYEGGVWKV